MRQNAPRRPGGVSRAATACYILFAALLLYAAARFSGRVAARELLSSTPAAPASTAAAVEDGGPARSSAPVETAAPVLAVRDYKRRLRTAGSEKEPLDLPASDVLYYELPEDGWLCVRPSGTEPKLKAYAGCKAADAAQAAARAAEMLDYAQSLLGME